MKTTNVAPAYVFKKLLLTLETMRSCAEKGPTPDPELVAIHGELAVINANFALLKGMAEHAIETIERLAGHTLDDAKAWMEPKPEMIERLKQVMVDQAAGRVPAPTQSEQRDLTSTSSIDTAKK
jgi:hypothetical protein